MKIKKYYPFILCFILIRVLISCEFWSDDILLSFSLPDLPRDYGGPPDSWKISILHGDLSCDIIFLGGASSLFSVTGKREEVLCILAEAVFSSSLILKPAGLFYDGRGDHSMRFEDGPALSVLYELALSGYPLKRFNGRRFMEELENRRESSPWFWDLESLSDLISRGDFSLIKLKSLPLYSVSLSWPGEDWVSEDTLVGLIGNEPLDLPPGHHRFFSLSTGLIGDVIVYEGGRYLSFDPF